MIEAAPAWGAALSVEERHELFLIKVRSKRLSALTDQIKKHENSTLRHIVLEHEKLTNYFNTIFTL